MAAGLLIGFVSLAIPLLRDFHWESAGAAALVVTFMAALLSVKRSVSSFTVLRKCTGLLTGWAIPLFVFAFFTNCLSFDGAAYWLFSPLPSMFLGWAVGRLVRNFNFKFRRSTVISIILSIAIIPVLVEFFMFPQLYFFNHVWGYWPGPIYDEYVPFDNRFLIFRGITFFWVLILWSIPGFFNEMIYRWITVLALFSILFSYIHASDWGLIAPEERLQSELGAVIETDHFRIFYTSGTVDTEILEGWANDHEEHLASISNALEIDKTRYLSEKIHSYVYQDARQKKKLTGAGQTSYVPVWIGQDQMHIASAQLNRVLKHELVHIIAKQFANWFGASTSIGLVEGLAVAIDPDRYSSTIDQLVAAHEVWPDEAGIRRLFSPGGFYAVAGPISYVVSGSFVKHLLENYPVENLKQAYRTGNIEQAYAPYTLEQLTDSWHRYLATVDVDEEDARRSVALFSTDSIFQKPCPRVDQQRRFREQFAGFSQYHSNTLQVPCS